MSSLRTAAAEGQVRRSGKKGVRFSLLSQAEAGKLELHSLSVGVQIVMDRMCANSRFHVIDSLGCQE